MTFKKWRKKKKNQNLLFLIGAIIFIKAVVLLTLYDLGMLG